MDLLFMFWMWLLLRDKLIQLSEHLLSVKSCNCDTSHGLWGLGSFGPVNWGYIVFQDSCARAKWFLYLQKYYGQCCTANTGYTYEVGMKAPALHVLMAQIDPANAANYGKNAMTFFNQYLTQSIPHTQKVYIVFSLVIVETTWIFW